MNNTKLIIKPPLLSTNFSKNGKSVKNRFDNILSMKSKKTGVLAFIIVTCVILIAGCVFKHSNKSISPISSNSYTMTTKLLFELKDTDVSDNAKISEIVHILPYPEISHHKRELDTKSRLYSSTAGIIINIKVNSRANYRFLDHSTLHQSAALIFSLFGR